MRSYDLGDTGIGLESTLGEWVANIVAVMREVKRVLRDDGTAWINLGDAYASIGRSARKESPGVGATQAMPKVEREVVWQAGGGHNFNWELPGGIRPKNLMGQPWRVAFALQDDGWLLRSAIVWHKPNPMPESVRDRPTNAYEMLFLLAKQGKYFYDAEAIREAHDDKAGPPSRLGTLKGTNHDRPEPEVRANINNPGKREYNPSGRNARNVWSIPTQGRPDAHFATYPDELPRRCILAGTSERGVCAACGAPWVRGGGEGIRATTRRVISQRC